MAFFVSSEGKHYFSVYYYTVSDGKYTGAFHEISEEFSEKFSRVYRFTCHFSVFLFAMQLLACIFAVARFSAFYESWHYFLLLEGITFIPAATMIFNKDKVLVSDLPMKLDKTKSIYCYASIVFLFLGCAITLIWSMMDLTENSGTQIAIVLFLMVSIASGWRLLRILRDKSALKVD